MSLDFYWRELGRQVVVLGTAEPVSDEEADAYFATRARGSQLGAWVSQQSRPLAGGRGHLLAEVARFEAHHLGGKIPRPPHWSGLRVVPHWIEIWVAGKFRLHDRTAYERADEGWTATKLSLERMPGPASAASAASGDRRLRSGPAIRLRAGAGEGRQRFKRRFGATGSLETDAHPDRRTSLIRRRSPPLPR